MTREDLRDQVTGYFIQEFGPKLLNWDKDLAGRMIECLYELVNLYGDDFGTAIYQMIDKHKRLSACVDED